MPCFSKNWRSGSGGGENGTNAGRTLRRPFESKMPRNDQVVRQWFLLEKLERSKGASIDELGRSLPPEYSRNLRTIRRDLEALETRFPLLTERRDGKTVWRLMDGLRPFAPAHVFANRAHGARGVDFELWRVGANFPARNRNSMRPPPGLVVSNPPSACDASRLAPARATS